MSISIHGESHAFEQRKREIYLKVSRGEITPQNAVELLKHISDNNRIDTKASNSSYQVNDIAVIGISSLLPDAENVDELWDNLVKGKDCISDVPLERWGAEYEDIKDDSSSSACDKMGVVEHIDKFDASFFNILPLDALNMDPQERVFMQEAWHALEDAGYANDRLDKKNCGIFVGAMGGDYKIQTRMGGLGNSFISARLAYNLDLNGPNMTIDTACSSSLVAIHQACQSLRNDECTVAVAGGVNVISTPDTHYISNKMGMLSNSGRCRTFDNDADGFVPAEGAAVVILKKLDKAIEDKDHIYAVIKGSAVNYDGATNGITAPGSPSQTALEKEVYERYDIDPSEFSYIECHGTGTKLGDPIEISAMKNAFAGYTDKKQFCYIGALKSNIGHTLAASGAAGVVKLMLCLEHKMLVPSINLSKENEHFDLRTTPFKVVRDAVSWDSKSPLKCAINSFGLSGINCHMVFEEYASPMTEYKCGQKELPFVFSAKKDSALKELLINMKEFFEKNDISDLDAISYTLLNYRKSYSKRLAIIAGSREELCEKIGSLIKLGDTKAMSAADQLGSCENEILKKIVTDYIGNGSVSDKLIKEFYGEGCPPVRLPVYPFEKRRYWLEKNDSKKNVYPYDRIHISSCDDNSLLLIKDISKNEPYIRDHRVNDHFVMPAAEYAEIFADLAEELLGSERIIVEDFYWVNMLTADEDKSIRIRISKEKDGLIFKALSDDDSETLYTKALISRANEETAAIPDLSAVRQKLHHKAERDEIYDYYSSVNIEYGRSFRGLENVVCSESEAIGSFEVTSSDGVRMSYSVFDSALQTIGAMACALGGKSGGTYVPYGIKRIELYNSLPQKGQAYVRVISQNRFDVYIYDENEKLCAYIKEFSTKTVSSGEVPDITYLVKKWKETDLDKYRNDDKRYNGTVIICTEDMKDFADEIAGYRESCRIVLNDKECFSKLGDLDDAEEIFFMVGTESEDNGREHLSVLGESDEKGVVSVYRLFGILGSRANRNTKLNIVTANQSALSDSDHVFPYYSSIYGFVGSAKKEYPDYGISVLDADLISPDRSRHIKELAEKVYSDMRFDSYSRIVVERDNRFFIYELESCEKAENADVFTKNGTYIIAGGLGGVGSETAKQLAEKYQADLILIGRSKLNDDKKKILSEIEGYGGKVEYIAADVTDNERMEAVISDVTERHGRIDGAVFSAFVLRDHMIRNMTEEELKEVVRVKARGTTSFVQLMMKAEAGFVITYSSIQTYALAEGQSNYAAASLFQDYVSEYFNRCGNTAVKHINWGYFGSFGKVSGADYKESITGQGLYSIESDEILPALRYLMGSDNDQIVSIKADSSVIETFIKAEDVNDNEKTADNTEPVVSHIGSYEEVENRVIACTIKELFMQEEDIDIEEEFAEMGIDSISGVKYINAINKEFNVNLKTTVLFETGNIRKLSEYLLENYSVAENDKDEEKVSESLLNNVTDEESEFKAVVLRKSGDISDIEICNITPKPPEYGEVQVIVKAFSLNFGDLLCVQGLYPTMPDYPFIPGFEFSGIIVKLGPGVTGYNIGDEVIGLTDSRMGAQSGIITVTANALTRKPGNVSFEEACAFPVVFMTVHHIFESIRVRENEKILIQSAAGGTGLIAVQYALAKGLDVYATAGSDAKLEYLAGMGVKHLINYSTHDFKQEILRMTENKGVDIVINTLSGEAIQKGMDILAPGGRYVELAMTGLKNSAKLDLSKFTHNQMFVSIDLRRVMLSDADIVSKYLKQVSETLAEGRIRPTVGKQFDFSDVIKAYEFISHRENIGKIVVRNTISDSRINEIADIERKREKEGISKIVTMLSEGSISLDQAEKFMEERNYE